MKLVYIASPYAGDVEANTKFARRACEYCIAEGNVPIAPHLLYPQVLDDSNPEQREIGLEMGREVLMRCDELWICGNTVSSGMAAEIECAKENGIPVHQVSTGQIFGAREFYGIFVDIPREGQSVEQGFLIHEQGSQHNAAAEQDGSNQILSF